MNCLLVDNSNTRTKFALWSPEKEMEVRIVPTAELSLIRLADLLRDWCFDEVYIWSVVPQVAALVAQACADAKVHYINYQSSTAVDFSGYRGVETLGADRVADVLGAVQQLERPLVAVDLGTATTYDVVCDKDGTPVFKGGLIAPGIASMAASLQARTAQLPLVTDWQREVIIGQDTQEAMGAALRIGYPAMVDAILDSIERELGEKINVVLTGGDAAAIAPLLRRSCKIDPLLTLRGIAFAAGIQL